MSTIEIVRREQKTETRIRAMDAHEIVDEIHAREDEIDQLVDRIAALRADVGAVAVAAWELYGWVITRSTTMPIQRIQKQVEPLGEALARPGVQAVLERVKDG